MGQQNVRDALEQRRMLLFHPEQLGHRVAGRNGDPQALQGARLAAQPVQQTLVLGRRLGVAPEFRRTQHLAFRIQGDQAMLLAGHTDAEHGRAIDAGLCQRCGRGLFEGIGPLLGCLLAATVGAAEQLMAGRAFSQHTAAGGIEQQSLGALGTAVDA